MFFRLKKLAGWVALVSLAGCGGRTLIPMDRLADPPRSESYLVTTAGGGELEFVTFHAFGDTLSGTVRTVRKRMVGQGPAERMEVRNEYREVTLPVSQVRSVEIRRGGPDRWVLAAGGALLLGGAWLVTRRAGGEDPTPGGTGKVPPGGP